MHQELPKDIRNILEMARLAPSSHNTQPWAVVVSGSHLVIGYNRERHLVVGDPSKKELFISLGCFVETVVAAAPAYGYSANAHFLGDRPDGVVKISLSKVGRKTDSEQLDLIRRRRSDRRHYQPKKIPVGILKELGNIEQGSASLKLFDDSKDIGFLAEMTSEATYKVMSNPAFREELASWVRHNWTRQPDGMPGYTQGIPGPISLFAKVIIRKNKKIAASQAKQDSRRVTHSAAVGLVCSTKDTPESWVDAGRVYQRACLAAVKYHIRTAGVSAAVVMETTAQQIKTNLGLSSQPVALIRFGYTKSVPKAAPRLSSDDFLATS